MKWLVLLLFFAASAADAEEYVFRGDFVETHLAEKGFLDRVPPGTRLNCEGLLCSSTGSVRIYVFRKDDIVKSFWSTDYYDVVFDGADKILACGETGHLAHYDETGQLLFRTCTRGSDHQVVGRVSSTSTLAAGF